MNNESELQKPIHEENRKDRKHEKVQIKFLFRAFVISCFRDHLFMFIL
jgi:hypothetical protein